MKRSGRMMVAAALVLVTAGCASSKAAVPLDPSSPTNVAASSGADDPSGSAGATDGATGSSSTAVGGHFGTLPVGSPLPSDADCAARVRPAKEVRPDNERFNQTQGHPTPVTADPNNPRFGRVTGAFTGTTDEIIQWVACKWGIDEDVVRAQAAKETYWFQKNLGDFGTDATRCVPGHPIGADGQADHCPESIGIMQVRYPYFQTTINDAIASTAYNLDLAYALWRSCYEGELQWLNTVERGQDYAAGDLWGCVGSWFAGRWYTGPAKDYMAAVEDYIKQRIWETSGFLEHTEP